MKIISIITVILLSSLVLAAERTIEQIVDYATQSPDELATEILRTRVIFPGGLVVPGDEESIYKAAIVTPDKKLKALLAIRALKTMPEVYGIGEAPSFEEKLRRKFDHDHDHKKLTDWYLELLREESIKSEF